MRDPAHPKPKQGASLRSSDREGPPTRDTTRPNRARPPAILPELAKSPARAAEHASPQFRKARRENSTYSSKRHPGLAQTPEGFPAPFPGRRSNDTATTRQAAECEK